jgi:hypothetical protein
MNYDFDEMALAKKRTLLRMFVNKKGKFQFQTKWFLQKFSKYLGKISVG